MDPVYATGRFKLAGKLKKAKVALKLGNSEVFGQVDLTIKELESRMVVLEE